MTPPSCDDDMDALNALAQDLDALFREPPPPPSPDPSCPPLLPDADFRLLRFVGAGGMGTVWEAEQLSLQRRVAVKVLSIPDGACTAWRERFVRESRIIAQLHHPGIVKVFAAGSQGETYWYAMELVDGVPLNRYAFSDSRSAVEGICAAAAALAYAHRCGVVHRDVKPSNLLVDAQGRVLVADFGLAVSAGDGTDADARDGTRRYMAPERLQNGVCGPAADQYALALVLRELLSHFDPGACGPDLLAVLDKAQAAEPEARYADMDAFSSDLRRALSYEPTEARRTSFFRRMVLWCRRHPRAAVATGAAIFCACGFVTALVVGYVRTETARRLAARNARVADNALTRVFDHVASHPPSLSDVNLLTALTPYYGELAGTSGDSDEKTLAALASQGVCAFRNSDYVLAEQAFRQLVARRRQPSDLNWLAETLRREGRKEEAASVAHRIVTEYSDSSVESDRLEVACAREVLGEGCPAGIPTGRRRLRSFMICHGSIRTIRTAVSVRSMSWRRNPVLR